jgi:HTH-type transcriptional regulator/antitoxin HigA
MKPIRTETDYQQALHRVGQIWDAQEGSPELDELDILVTLIEKYESINYPLFEGADPIEVLKQTIEDKRLKKKICWGFSEVNRPSPTSFPEEGNSP